MITLFNEPFFNGVFDAPKFLKTPETNISKNDDGYTIKMSIPGLTKEDLKILTKEGILKISFDRDEKNEEHNFTNSFVRLYNIPDNIKEKEITGKVENGVLTLRLPIDRKKSLERLISLN